MIANDTKFGSSFVVTQICSFAQLRREEDSGWTLISLESSFEIKGDFIHSEKGID